MSGMRTSTTIIEEPHPIDQDQPPPTRTLTTSHHRPGRSRSVTTDQDAHDQPPPASAHDHPSRITYHSAHRTRAAGSNASLNSRTHCLKSVDTFRPVDRLITTPGPYGPDRAL